MIDTIITQYIKKHNIKKFEVEDRYWAKDNWSLGLKLGRDVAFFYETNIICDIAKVSDLSKGLFSLTSPGVDINYKNLIKAADISGAIQLTSAHISIHTGQVNHVEASSTVYSTIYSGYYKYVLLKITD